MANKTIPDLVPAAAFALTDLVEISDGSGTSKSVTGTQIQTAITTGFQTSLPVVDTTAVVKGSADATKQLRFEVDGFTAGATRVATPPNQDFTIAGINVAQIFSVTQTFTPAASTRAIDITGASIAGASSQNFVSIVGTWATSGTPSAFKMSITDSSSNAASKLMAFDVAGSEVFSLGKTGALNFVDDVRQTFNPGANVSGLNVGSVAGDPGTPVNGDLWYESGANELHARINGATIALGAGGGGSPPFIDSTAIIKGSADATKLLRIEVDGFAAATTRVATPPNQDFTMAGLEVQQTFTKQQTITPAVNTSGLVVSGFSLTGANAQSLIDLAGTWNTAGAPIGIKLNITNTASDPSSLLMDLQIGGASKLSVNNDGAISAAAGNLLVTAAGNVNSQGRGDFVSDITASSTLFSVVGGEISLNSSITFSISGSTFVDDGAGQLTITANRLLLFSNCSFQLGVTAVLETVVQSHTITVFDDTGTGYKLLCIPV